jgi:hypothetical protein
VPASTSASRDARSGTEQKSIHQETSAGDCLAAGMVSTQGKASSPLPLPLRRPSDAPIRRSPAWSSSGEKARAAGIRVALIERCGCATPFSLEPGTPAELPPSPHCPGKLPSPLACRCGVHTAGAGGGRWAAALHHQAPPSTAGRKKSGVCGSVTPLHFSVIGTLVCVSATPWSVLLRQRDLSMHSVPV